MTVFGGRPDLVPPYIVSGGRRFSDWADQQPEITRLEAQFWISGLYWKPYQAPSVPLERPSTAPPDDVRRAVLQIQGLPPVTTDYDVWDDLGVVRLLRIR